MRTFNRISMLRALGLLVIPVLLAAVACSGGSGDKSDSPTATSASAGLTPTATQRATTPVPTRTGIAPTATPVRSNVATSGSDFAFNGDVVTVGFTSDWRVSAQTDESITYTHVSAPGDVLLNVFWVRNAPNDIGGLFTQRMELLANGFQELDGTTVSGVAASRYLTTFLAPDGEVATVTLSVVFIVRGTAVLASYSAPPDIFETYAESAEAVIASIKVN